MQISDQIIYKNKQLIAFNKSGGIPVQPDKTGDKSLTDLASIYAKIRVFARLSYRLLASSDNYHLLEVQLHTGRQHQIRVQLAAIGSPIKGDVKYGARRGNKDRSIQLHSWKMAFNHPVTNERVELQAPVPEGGVWAAFREVVE